MEDHSDPSLLCLLDDKEAECCFSSTFHSVHNLYWENCIIIFLQISISFLKWCICSSGDCKIKTNKNIDVLLCVSLLFTSTIPCALLSGENLVSSGYELLKNNTKRFVFNLTLKSSQFYWYRPKSQIAKLPQRTSQFV